MTEKEKRVIEKMTEIIPKLTNEEKARTLGFVEGVAFLASMGGEKSAPDRPTAM